MKNSTLFKILSVPAMLLSLAVVSAPAHAQCAGYRLSAFGGDAGLRVMNNPRDFRKVSNGSVRGEICGGGQVKVELSKRQPGTHVSLDIAGREYTFGQGDRGNRVENNWFRRYFTIDLPRQRPYNQQRDGYHDNGQHRDHRYADQGRGSGHGYGYPVQRYGHNGGGHAYQDNYYQGGQGYGNQGYGSQGYGNHGYDDHGWRSQQLPRYRIGTKNHKRAHRKGIPHDHYGNGYAWH